MIHYPIPPHLQPAYVGLNLKEGDFPVSERMANEVLSLPMGPHLTESECLSVVQKVHLAARTGCQ
jgi:dTDP-4-amino-4,6-dideoxygalactose transaminase